MALDSQDPNQTGLSTSTGAVAEYSDQMPSQKTPSSSVAGQSELTPERANETVSLDAIMQSVNFAEEIKSENLNEIGTTLHEEIDIDLDSRSEWEEKYEDYLKLATQVMEYKSMPWPGASNIKYPLLTIACMQFAARAYHQLVPGPTVVKARVIGKDDTGTKLSAANRVSKFMSWQCLEDMPTWEDDMDRMCIVLPICGNVFKKTYHASDGKNISELVLPKDLIVNYYAKNVDTAPRKTHVLYYHPNEIVEKIRTGEFIEFDYADKDQDKVETYENSQISNEGDTPSKFYTDAIADAHGIEPPSGGDRDAPHVFYECHCWWDLDEDGYKEPYIITLHKETQKVVRIVARYSPNNVITNDKGDIAKIIPDEYFTNFLFVPDPNSGVYGLGFGTLLGPINETANTLINQLVDAGTLSNLPSGFLARGIRIPGGQNPLKPGEWRHVNTIADDLRKGIVPLPIKEPSNVLFQLLQMMLDSGQQLSSVTSLMVGENPGQNQPYSTTSEVLKQGLQVFSSIYKRIHRSLKKEFKKLYKLNELYLTQAQYFTVLDYSNTSDTDQQMQIFPDDFDSSTMNVVPASDPSLVDSSEKIAKADSLLQILQTGGVNPREAIKRYLEAHDYEDIQALMDIPEPQPNFDQEMKKQELELKKQQQDNEFKIDQYKAEADASKSEAESVLALAKAQAESSKQEMQALQMTHEKNMAEMKERFEAISSQAKVAVENAKAMNEERKANTMKYQRPEQRNPSNNTNG